MGVRPLPAEQPCGCWPVAGDQIPIALLTEFIHDDALTPPLHALTVDYERGSWRAGALADHLLEWTMDYALRPKERGADVPSAQWRTATRTALKRTFGSAGDQGVPGELLLHAFCRQVFGSDTAVNKVFFKSSRNETYHGFDAVHVVHGPDGLELWLGEAKFYTRLDAAIRDALSELAKHLETDYLREEFALVSDKIDDEHPHAGELRGMLGPSVSLDTVFRRVCVPVLLTYDSTATIGHSHDCAEYREALEAELRRGWTKFKNGVDGIGVEVAVRLILVPLATKQALRAALTDLLGRPA